MLEIGSHRAWLEFIRPYLLEAQVAEFPMTKQFRILNPSGTGEVEPIDISINRDQPMEGGSSAEPSGWVVTVTPSKAPDTQMFSSTYPDQKTAEQVFDDLSLLAGEVEGKLKQSDFEGAGEASKAFQDRLKSNSGAAPNPEPGPQ